ncbi:MAG: hypothetical protein V3W19_17910 [Desulfatiglandales bacterium]
MDGHSLTLFQFKVKNYLPLCLFFSMVPELAREIERARIEAGLNVDDMLEALQEQRKRYVKEKYGQKT